MTTFQLQEGKKVDVVTTVFAGGEGRYQDWVYLKMLERGWTRPLSEADRFMDVAESSRPSARAEVAVTFWTYFETRIERLMRQAMCDLPEAVMEDLLRRYSSIGSRLDRLYGLLFDATYWQDLGELGFEPVSRCLQRLHQRRNEFAHGHPEAIDDALVTDLVNSLKDEHEAWIAVFNKRTARLHTS